MDGRRTPWEQLNRQHAEDIDPEEDEVNPPWDRISMRMPAISQAQADEMTHTPAQNVRDAYEDSAYDSMMERSMAGMSMGDFTGTGKVAVTLPIRPSASGWGLRAPRRDASSSQIAVGPNGTASIAVDDQPSIQMRALRTSNLIRATTIVTGALIVSRILGLLRTTLFAATFGGGFQASAFTNAFTLPDTIFNIVSGGALASAFIPVFTSYLIEKRDRNTAWYVASVALNAAIAVLVVLCGLGIIFARPFLELTMAPFFQHCNTGCQGPLIVSLTRVMLLQPIFLGAATITIAILQARQSFVLPAIGQVIYTGSLVGGIMATQADNRYQIFGGHLGIYGPTWGVVVGAALQFFIQIPGLFGAKMAYKPALNVLHPGVVEIGKLMLPRLLNAAILYVSVFINRDLLGLLNQQAATFGYVTAFSLVMLPQGIFGMAVSQAAFPTLAAFVAAGEWTRLRETVVRTIKGISYLAIPSALGMIVLADPISRVILAHGAFEISQLPFTVQPLIFFSIGLTGLALVEILTRSFYAIQDTRTPTIVSILQFMFLIGMSIILLPLGSGGLALASSLAWTGEALTLILLLRPRLAGLDLKDLGMFTLSATLAAVAAALTALLVYRILILPFVLPIGETSKTETFKMLFRLALSGGAGAGVYLFFSRFLAIDDVVPFDRLLKRVLRRG
ncbi:MAG TPA: murein biosynthesis integral membrane protein MurJ [Ktedonobacterales bacterium]|nr:murein biosynthesis integral membrane protein MurJ [Ktedonobacterales bacterium]